VVAGAAPCPPLLRGVVGEQLADLTRDLVWVCHEHIDAEDTFRSAPGGQAAVRISIDLRAGTEARLALGDARSDRFVIRRVPLRNGLDEVEREQIGQIVRFATLALREGTTETLTRAEARAVVASWQPPPRNEPAPVARAPAARQSAFAVDLGPVWSLRLFSRELPVVQELTLGAAIGRPASHLRGWLEAGYQLPARYHAEPVGVELSAASLRFGFALGHAATRSLSFRGGAGVRIDRVSFAPIDATGSVAPSAANGFWSAGARFLVGGDWRVAARLTLGARIACDIAADDVHYDLVGSDGVARRVLTASRVAPSVGVGVAWSL
jgi:hypothetical protein